MKIQFINSPLPSYMSSCLRSSAYPPLNILSLSTHVKNHLPHIEIENLDGEILGKELVIEKVDADFVGISSNSLSYETAVEIAQQIKLKRPNCTIILGGSHATQLYDIIARNQKCFDLIIRGKGEYAIVDILKNKPWDIIPNCVFLKGDDSLVQTEFKSISLRNLPFPDFSLISLEDYHINFQKHYPDKDYKKGVPAYSSSGCAWRLANDGGCIYCSIPDWKYSIIDPVLYWEYIHNLSSIYGIDFIWDVSDNFTSPKKWLKNLAYYKPKNINVGFNIYARLDDLTEQCIRTLKEIGVKEILVGIESYDNQILHNANKGIDRHCIKKALKLLNEYDIDVAISFVIGIPGESNNSLNTTLNELEGILHMSNIIENHTSVIMPLPGSPVFNKILKENSVLGPKYCETDLPDLQALQWEYLERYTECGAQTVFDYYVKFDTLFRSAGPFYYDKRSTLYEQMSFKDAVYS